MATIEANICIFCGRAGGSKEHVFPDWLTDVLPGEGSFTSSGSSKRTKESSRLAITTRSVCVTCNTTWMSEMESDTKPLITPAILGNAVSWSSDEQQRIASWAVKTALTADSSNPTRFAPVEHGHLLHGTPTVPPPGTQVSAGILSYHLAAGELRAAGAHRTLLQIRRESGAVQPGYRVLLTAGQLVLQVIGAPDLDFSEVEWERTLERNGMKVEDFLRRLWPVDRDPLEWPPRTALDEQLWALLGGT